MLKSTKKCGRHKALRKKQFDLALSFRFFQSLSENDCSFMLMRNKFFKKKLNMLYYICWIMLFLFRYILDLNFKKHGYNNILCLSSIDCLNAGRIRESKVDTSPSYSLPLAFYFRPWVFVIEIDIFELFCEIGWYWERS